MKSVKRSLLAIGVAMGLAPSFSGWSWAHERGVQTKEGASIVVDGVVREIFRSPRQNQTDLVVQIEVARSEYGRAPADPRRVQAPAPGDQIYVHVFQASADPHRSAVGGHNSIPAERSQIRAYLYPRQQGGWEGAFPDWFDATRAPQLDRGPHDPEPPYEAAATPAPAPAPAPAPTPAPAPSSPSVATTGSILQKLGIRAEQIQVSGRLVLKVIDLVPDGPAAKAGIEVDDTLIGVNGGFITDLDQLAAAIQKGGPVATMAVLDHRTNQTQPVKVDVSSIFPAQAPQTPQPEPAPAAPTRTLGVKLEQVRLGLRTTAVRVTEVQEGSPAAKAGIEPGDVLLSADGTPAETPDQFIAVVQKSGPVLNLKVLDSRTRREVPVQVHFKPVAAAPSGSAPAPGNVPRPAPAPTPSSGPTSARSLGIVVEAGTADLLPVVKVVQVVPGSPAEKAGIEPGDAIVGLDDKVIFAPELLDEALRTAGSSFTLNVLDVKTGKKTPVKINIP